MRIRPYEYGNDVDYDRCGKHTEAILEMDSMTICLCKECLNELIQEMEDFKKHIYCYECEEFRRSTCGYYASCNKKAKDNGIDLDYNQNLIGVKFSTDSYDYCVDGKKKIKENTINKDREKEQKMIDEFIETRERFIKSEEIFLSYLKSRL